MAFEKRSSLLSVLICLTLLSIAAQLSLFVIHNHTTDVLDAFVGSSIPANFFHHAILLPVIEFFSLQVAAYLLFIAFIWFITMACSEVLSLPAYGLGIFFWLCASLVVFGLNAQFFPDSFFAVGLPSLLATKAVLLLTLLILGLATALAYYQLIRRRRYRRLGLIFFSLVGLTLLASLVNDFSAQTRYHVTGTPAKPNIILIGLDSLRPDYTGYFGSALNHTPHIDQFLRKAVTFKEVYTPLARTFPAWVSILTGKHPKNSHARINLGYAAPVVTNDTLARQLKAANYATIYATDEKRFSNITEDYGFDQLIGPSMGLNDFILGGLSDFPLTNLLVNLPIGRFLFPYNYANRAAAITYEPDRFLQLVKAGLQRREDKPLFLALHFCVTHWPFTWANDRQPVHLMMNERYRSSVAKVDQQLGDLLQILKENGLLGNSIVVLLSDHGTSFGLPGDRLLDQRHYHGDPARLKWVTVNQLSQPDGDSLDLEKSYSLNTAYGQGTDVLSLKQYQVLLAFQYLVSAVPANAGIDHLVSMERTSKAYARIQQGESRFSPLRTPHREKLTGTADFASSARNSIASLFPAHAVQERGSLLDIAPTLLALLHLPPMKQMDGLSLVPFLFKAGKAALPARPLYLETGYSVSELETNKIEVEKVISRTIHLYQVNPENGYLYIKPSADAAVLENKQRAILFGPWLLARYPALQRTRLIRSRGSLDFKTEVQPAYYLLANIQTGEWTMELDTTFAKKAPVAELRKKLKAFYGGELLLLDINNSLSPSLHAVGGGKGKGREV